MIAHIPNERPSLEEILKDPWLKEINDLDEKSIELKNLNEALKQEFEEIFNILKNKNTIKVVESTNNGQKSSNKNFVSEKKLFENNIEPKKLDTDTIDINNGIIIEGYINAVDFMNTLAENIKKKYNNNCAVQRENEIELQMVIAIPNEEDEEDDKDDENKEEEKEEENEEKEEEEEEINNNNCVLYIELLKLQDNKYFANFIKGNGKKEDHYKHFIKIREIIKDLLIN